MTKKTTAEGPGRIRTSAAPMIHESRLAETVIGQRGPARIARALFPLKGYVLPGGHMEFKVVARRCAAHKIRGDNRQGKHQREQKSDQERWHTSLWAGNGTRIRNCHGVFMEL
jgi:hypothetical protein